MGDQFSLLGGWGIYYPRRFRFLRKTSVSWPFGRLDLEGERITLTARGSLGRIFSTIAPQDFPVAIPLSQITRVERLHWRRKFGTLRFRSLDERLDRTTFAAFQPGISALVERLRELGLEIE